MHPISSVTLALSTPTLASTVIASPSSIISSRNVSSYCRRAIVQPVPLMTNSGTLTMGFAGVDPRQTRPQTTSQAQVKLILSLPTLSTHAMNEREQDS